ncbi:NapC/NirT family cytochrome c [Geoalkalibacter sp.]|uniref:NapC/NirT family cytochrome c n=1 Tax=Geoalkalibacter sp. TaxID=3041440 RepID=UPI00272EC736|nr:NapC/NirT family cytochrome c [Geoalkalibacter sp.]
MKNLSPNALIILGVIALIVIVGVGWGAAKQTSKESFCVTCHAYEKVSWDHGKHPDIGCIACHTKGVIRDKTAGMRKVFLTLTDQVDPHRSNLPSYKDKINDNCIACHMTKEKLDLMPFFKERHDEYRKHSPTCMGCHEAGHVVKLRDLRRPEVLYKQ